jgi:hypothetical protein
MRRMGVRGQHQVKQCSTAAIMPTAPLLHKAGCRAVSKPPPTRGAGGVVCPDEGDAEGPAVGLDAKLVAVVCTGQGRRRQGTASQLPAKPTSLPLHQPLHITTWPVKPMMQCSNC